LPWIAIGDFLNEWFDYSRDQRADLVADRVMVPAVPTPDLQRWATFYAASAEWLCSQYKVPCPAWVGDPLSQLPEPYFDAPQAHKPDVRTWLLKTTPEPLQKTLIICGL
jgi:hypothetical protein